MQERANVFISATTADLGSYRLAVRDVLLDRGVHPILQDHLEPDYQTMMAILRQAIDACDAVICLVGLVYGQEPKHRRAGAPRHSYTQLEFEIAEAFDKPIYVFLAHDQCPCDPHPDEPPELRQLQLAHRERLRQCPHKREYFDSLADLRYRIATIPFAEPGPVVDKPHNLPYLSLGPHFKGREPFLAELRQKLTATPNAAAAIIARQAIHGLGGVGKTCLAVEYAWRYQAEYTALLFVLADTPANLRRNLAALVGPLVLNLAEQQAQEEEVQVTAALHWLEAHHGWLLILDNVDTEDAAQAVEHLLPRLRRGHVLITSRLTLWHGAEPLALDVLTEPDAAAFLLERTAGYRALTPHDEADALDLARTLGGLALALEQAGAYIQHLRCSLREYLERWRSQEPRVRAWFDARLMHYPRSVAVTWETTLAQLDESARALLRLLAWLAPDPIPRALFHGVAADQVFTAAVAGPTGTAPVAAVTLEEALAALAKYSLLKWTDATNASVQVHRLVQETTRGRLAEEEQRFWLEQALRLVDAAVPAEPPPNDVRSWSVWDPLRPHVAAVVAQADQAGMPAPPPRLMGLMGLFLQSKGAFAEAEPLMRRALAIDEAAYGPTHPTVATHLNNLAELLRATNRLAEAEPLSRRMVSIFKHFNDSTGHDHPHWQAALANYVGLLQAMGLSQDDMAQRLQDVAGGPASRSESDPVARGLLTRLWRGMARWWQARQA